MEKSTSFIFALILCAFSKSIVSQVPSDQVGSNVTNEDVPPLSANNSVYVPLLRADNVEETIHQFPYLAHLVITKSNMDYECVGSIISEHYILTAAHCILGASAVSARVGSTNANTGGTQYKAKEIVAHPLFASSNFDNDVGYIRLNRKMLIDGYNTRILSLAPNGTPVAPGTTLTLAGWGAETEDDDKLEYLTVIRAPVVPDAQCRKPYGTLAATAFCVGAPDEGMALCQGNAGGPAVSADGIQRGIVSRGVGCAYPEVPGAYTKLSSVRSWIKSSTGV